MTMTVLRSLPRRCAIVLCLVALGALAVAAPVRAADQIVYTCQDANSFDLCVINPDNPLEHAHLITTSAADEQSPAFSPDGTRIAYDGEEPGQYSDVFVAPFTGAAITEATDVSDTAERIEGPEAPAWSPDGTRLAFTSQLFSSGSDRKVLVSAADGTTVSVALAGGLAAALPSWSPDGTRIAANCCGGQVVTAAPDGSGTATELGEGSGPVWSPDGTYFGVIRGTPGSYRAGVLRADGSRTFKDLGSSHDMADLEWSPDSTRITFVTSHSAGEKVAVAAVDGLTPPVEISLPGGFILPRDPTFSPDGTRIAFDAANISGSESHRQLLLAPADGSATATAIPPYDAGAYEPEWKPRPVSFPPAGGGGTPGTTPGAGGGSGKGGGAGAGGTKKTPVVVQLGLFNHPAIIGHSLPAAGINCNVAGGHPTGAVAEFCAAHGTATYTQGASSSGGFRLAARPKSIVFAAGAVRVPAGKKKTLKLKITAAGQKLLKPGRKLKLKLALTLKAGSGKPTKRTSMLTVEVPKKK